MESSNPVQDYIEVQEHRYDPGHFTGGNLHPMLKSRKRPNRYGYVLVLVGVLFLSMAILALVKGDTSGLSTFEASAVTIIWGALALLLILAGFKLAKGTDTKPKSTNRSKENPKI